MAKPATSANTPPPPAKSPGLPKPLYPSCAVKRFQKPHVDPYLGDNGGQYWRLIYQIPVAAPRVVGAMTIATIVEQTPNLPRGTLSGARNVTIASHNVSLRLATSKTPSNVAQWKTSKARYILLADGSIAALKPLIACLP